MDLEAYNVGMEASGGAHHFTRELCVELDASAAKGASGAKQFDGIDRATR